jgi:hypothetical protein
MVAPITAPRDDVTLRSLVGAWLPPGIWADLFTGLVYDGDRRLHLHRDMSTIPVLLKGGGILPLASDAELDAQSNPEHLELVILPGADGDMVLVEDDGTGTGVDDTPTARTTLSWRQVEGRSTLAIGQAEGSAGVVAETRSWTIRLVGVAADFDARVRGVNEHAVVIASGVLTIIDAPTNQPIRVDISGDLTPMTIDPAEALFSILNAAQMENRAKLDVWGILCTDHTPEAKLAELRAIGAPDSLIGAVGEVLTSRCKSGWSKTAQSRLR